MLTKYVEPRHSCVYLIGIKYLIKDQKHIFISTVCACYVKSDYSNITVCRRATCYRTGWKCHVWSSSYLKDSYCSHGEEQVRYFCKYGHVMTFKNLSSLCSIDCREPMLVLQRTLYLASKASMSTQTLMEQSQLNYRSKCFDFAMQDFLLQQTNIHCKPWSVMLGITIIFKC